MVNIIFLEFVQFRCKYNVIFIFINMWGIYFKLSLAIIKCIYFTYIYIYTHTYMCVYVCMYTHRQFLSIWKRKGITVCTHHSGLGCYRQVNSEEPVYLSVVRDLVFKEQRVDSWGYTPASGLPVTLKICIYKCTRYPKVSL